MATDFVSPREQQSTPNIWKIFARDVAVVASFGILLLCIHEFGTPFVRGFNCNDETIRYPYKDSTVSSNVCYLVGSGINVLSVCLLEYFNLIDNNHVNNNDPNAVRNRDGLKEGFQFKTYTRNVYCRLVLWFFGSIASELLTDISKFTAGRLRPHFLDICQPRIPYQSTNLTLDEYCLQTEPYKYITGYYCTGEPNRLRDSRLSFLSGHSSYSAYSAAFAVIYIQSKMSSVRFGLMKPLFQVLIISAAFYTGLTRVSDYKHHWQDVLAGLTLGTAVASMVHIHMWPSFYRTYLKLSKALDQRTQPGLSGEELNSFSY